jgi:pyruvate,orthophosphate dikinase
MTSPRVYAFGRPDDAVASASLVGHRGHALAAAAGIGAPVPPGFTISTEAFREAHETGGEWSQAMWAEVDAAIQELEARTGLSFDDPKRPLLVSVRAGLPVSLPGLTDSVLDVGLREAALPALADRLGSADRAWDVWRRYLQALADTVLDVHYTALARAVDAALEGASVDDLDEAGNRRVSEALVRVIAEAGKTLPSAPRDALRASMDAVYRAYTSHRARYHRRKHGLPDDSGVAITVQAMVFGNAAGVSGGGVIYTRDPETGAPGVCGQWLPGLHGELPEKGGQPIGADGDPLDLAAPEARARLFAAATEVEAHFRDHQQLEFVLERGELWILEVSTGARSAAAAIQIAVDLAEEGVIERSTALGRVDPKDLEMVLRPTIRPGTHRRVIAKGLDASPGAATGRVVFDASECQELAERDVPTVLVRVETSPEDIQGMEVAQGLLTSRGGHTSHAAVMARSRGKPCVVGCTEIQVDYSRELFYAGDSVVRKGDWVTIDGSTGEVFEGQVETVAPRLDSGAMATLLGWADQFAQLTVRANADNGADARRARDLGATGIGLCRTEHMFFQPDALRALRRMILAHDPRSRQRALHDILPIQRRMFREIFEAMAGLPVTVRLLDPPLHEFLPRRDEDVSAVSEDLGVRVETLIARLDDLAEANPMLGHRGVRVGITNPEVYRTQVRALFEAACELVRNGVDVRPEVMIPLVALPSEVARVRALIVETAEEVIAEYECGPAYTVGTMIELPRACLCAGDIARHADFFSFGTNDLTQAVYGMSRDDLSRFLRDYQREGVMAESPLVAFDEEGVGQLVELGVRRGLEANPHLKVGVCGEHGGDPEGVAFFHRIGLHYVSCSPYRVPVARLAAAMAALADEGAT